MKEPHDVIVVGSGAGGGMSAYVLTQAGLKVLILEAGLDYVPATETPMFNLPSEAPLRAASTPDKPFGFYDATVDGCWEVPNEPYTVAEGTQFRWWRTRMLGGRTNHWGRFCLAASRLAILTRPYNGRPPCLYATRCFRGCSIAANFQSTTVLIPPARKTGNLDIRTNALVYQVDINKRGLAKGVSFVDRRTGQHHSARAKAVVLAASPCESARILLNSKSALCPQGMANETGLVGRYLTDSARTYTLAHFPALEKLGPCNDDGVSMFHLYVPWRQYAQQARKELNFPGGYYIEPRGGRLMPEMWRIDGYARVCEAPYGAKFRDEMRRKYGNFFGFHGCGEMVSSEKSFVELDPNIKDKWGIPVLRFHWEWGEHELRQVAHQRRTFLELIERLGGTAIEGRNTDGAKAIQSPGVIHEVAWRKKLGRGIYDGA